MPPVKPKKSEGVIHKDDIAYIKDGVIVLKQEHNVACCVCKLWWQSYSAYSSRRPGQVIAANKIHLDHVREVDGVYYVLPSLSTGDHKDCREVFNLCPPM